LILKSEKGSNFKSLYATVIKTLKILPKIREFVQETKKKEKLNIRNIYLFAVQVNEYFNDKCGRIGGSI